MNSRLIKAIVVTLTALSIFPTCAFAGNDWRKSDWSINDVKQYKMNVNYEYSNYIRTGGINTIDGIEAESREESEQLETHLKENGYILINTKEKQISDEEFELMKKVFQQLGVNSYALDSDKPYYYENLKIYLNKDVYDTCLKQVKESSNGYANEYSILELATSYVVVNYLVWNSIDNIGKVYTNELINDNIKKYDEENGTDLDKYAGYIYIITDMDSRIIFSERYSKTFQQIDVVANVPTLVKICNGYYKIDTINDVSIDEDESLLGDYNNNIFRIDSGFTADNPIVIDLTKGVNEKYGIEPYNIEGNVDFRDNKWIDVDPDEYKVTVENESESFETDSNDGELTIASKIILGMIFVALLITGSKEAIAIKKKEGAE
jgi:hypothetical protein